MSRSEDVAALPDRTRDAAIWLDNGEVMWPFDEATRAVTALADAGHVVLGIDARERSGAGVPTEIPISAFEPSGHDDVERGRQSAIASIGRAESVSGWEKPNLLVTWR